MTNATPVRYRDADGVWHTLKVRRSTVGWQVVDHHGEQERVIETLSGVGEGRPQADAIVRDYLTTVGRCPAEGEASTAGAGRS